MVLNAQEKYQKTDDLFGESLEIDLPLYIKKDGEVIRSFRAWHIPNAGWGIIQPPRKPYKRLWKG